MAQNSPGPRPGRKSKWISAEAFRRAALDGVNTGLFRLRTADMRLDWEHTSVIVGQDGLFISPLSPTSFASLAIPSMGYSGNLWAWTPQLRIEHRFDLSDGQNVIVQGGILDNLTGEPSYGTHRTPQAGELSGQPAYAARVGWSKDLNGRPISFGTSGYYSRQNWGFDWNVDGWAAVADWRFPVAPKFELSGEFYRGRAVGGLGGGIGQSILYSGNPLDPASDFRGRELGRRLVADQILGHFASRIQRRVWSGRPLLSDIHAFATPVDYYPVGVDRQPQRDDELHLSPAFRSAVFGRISLAADVGNWPTEYRRPGQPDHGSIVLIMMTSCAQVTRIGMTMPGWCMWLGILLGCATIAGAPGDLVRASQGGR